MSESRSHKRQIIEINFMVSFFETCIECGFKGMYIVYLGSLCQIKCNLKSNPKEKNSSFLLYLD